MKGIRRTARYLFVTRTAIHCRDINLQSETALTMLQTLARAVVFVVASVFTIGSAVAQEMPPKSKYYELDRVHLEKRDNAYLLVHTIASTASKDRFWALVEVNNTDGSRKCEWLKVLEPKQRYRFECQVEATAGQKYPSRVRVYADARLTNRELFYEPVLDITAERLSAAAAVNDSTATVVPDGTFEADELALPATFKPTWYRRVDKGFGLRAYENSGDLTVSSDQLLFVDGKKTVRIPHPQILSVRWEPLPNDIANHWVVVRFKNEDGKEDGVAFRDGGRMGLRGETGPIYQALRRAAKK
jgi:hypothetical protein